MSDPQSKWKNRKPLSLRDFVALAWGPVDAALEARLDQLELERSRNIMDIAPEPPDFTFKGVTGRHTEARCIIVDDPLPALPVDERQARLRAAVEKWWKLRLEAGHE